MIEKKEIRKSISIRLRHISHDFLCPAARLMLARFYLRLKLGFNSWLSSLTIVKCDQVCREYCHEEPLCSELCYSDVVRAACHWVSRRRCINRY